MRDFFLTNGPTLVWAITALHLLLWTVRSIVRLARGARLRQQALDDRR